MRRLFTALVVASCATAVLLTAAATAAVANEPALPHGGVVYATVSAHGAQLRALVDSGGYDLIDPEAVARLRLPTVPVMLGRTQRRAVIDAPDHAFLVARPGAFEATFLDIPQATVSLSFLRRHPITIDYRRASVSVDAPGGAPRVIPLVVRSGPAPSRRLDGVRFAAVKASVAGTPALWLLDTGAQARFVGETGVTQVSAIDARVAERWHRAHPEWTYRSDAAVYAGDDGASRVDAIAVPLTFAGLPVRTVWCVIRHEDRSFDYLSRAFGEAVVGDAGATAFGARRVTFDLQRSRLEIR